MRCHRLYDLLRLLAKGGRLVVAEEQTTMHVAGARDHGHCQVADDRQVALRHAEVRAAFAIAWVGANIVGANDAATPKGGLEEFGVARQTQASKRLARRTRERIEQVALALAVGDVVEEGAELRSAQFGGDVRYRLDDALQIEIGGNGLGQTIERLEPTRLIAERVIGMLAGGDIDVLHQFIQDVDERIPGAYAGERGPLAVEH